MVVEAIDAGNVRVDGRRARKGQPVAAGQLVLVRLGARDATPAPEDGPPLQVIHEDPSFVVVCKRSGEPTHPLVAGELGTLANRIVARFPECGGASPDPREGGVAHRLDTPTSGLVVVARSRAAWESLRHQFTAREVEKEYLALVAAEVAGELEIDVPIGGVPGSPGRMRALSPEGGWRLEKVREAHTRVEVEGRYPGWTLVRCVITTGVMHQIRVHLSHVGHPVAGDDRYGGPSPSGLRRLFLHAAVLGFHHPTTNEKVRFESALPSDLVTVLRGL